MKIIHLGFDFVHAGWIGKDLDHPRNTHTYMSDCTLLAKCLRQTEGVETVVSNDRVPVSSFSNR